VSVRGDGPRDWDAATYDRVSDPQVEWALEVLDRLPLRGDETVLDAGCGSGRVTRLLLERLPRGRVVAVDAAPAMVEQARAALGDRATVLLADLAELELDEPVDAVFSNAVFHWVADHERLFTRLHAALRPGGRLVAQCGGEGNVERFLAVARAVAEEPPFADYLAAGPARGASRRRTRRRAASRAPGSWRSRAGSRGAWPLRPSRAPTSPRSASGPTSSDSPRSSATATSTPCSRASESLRSSTTCA
jgi:trans-aconitate methyltransferase